MSSRKVTTQEELDAALSDAVETITIDSPQGVWLEVRHSGSSRVEARGSSHVVARESSRVVAWESSRVVAWGSSRVVAWGSSSVEAWESSRVVAWESSRVEARESSSVVAWGSSRVEAWESSRVVARGSSRVVAWGSSRVVAWESSHVEAWESSSVEARESSRVEARESSHVVAWGSSRVEAWGSSSVEARGSSRVVAGAYVAVHLHSAAAAVSGGVVIDINDLDLRDPAIWCEYHGAATGNGTAIVYKAVSPVLTAGQGRIPTTYAIGETITAPDWKPTAICGNGLHFGVTPGQARNYYQGDRTRVRFLACEIGIEGAVPLGEKIKAPSCRVLHEVTITGEPLA